MKKITILLVSLLIVNNSYAIIWYTKGKRNKSIPTEDEIANFTCQKVNEYKWQKNKGKKIIGQWCRGDGYSTIKIRKMIQITNNYNEAIKVVQYDWTDRSFWGRNFKKRIYEFKDAVLVKTTTIGLKTVKYKYSKETLFYDKQSRKYKTVTNNIVWDDGSKIQKEVYKREFIKDMSIDKESEKKITVIRDGRVRTDGSKYKKNISVSLFKFWKDSETNQFHHTRITLKDRYFGYYHKKLNKTFDILDSIENKETCKREYKHNGKVAFTRKLDDCEVKATSEGQK